MNTLAVDGRRIIDNFGRERIFNGLNFVYKGCEPDEDGVIRYKSDITDDAARGSPQQRARRCVPPLLVVLHAVWYLSTPA